MSSVVKKHEYRFRFLKSHEWKTVRLRALARDKGRCRLCRFRDLSNDAHHVWYDQNVWDTKAIHLVTLCRPCHDLVHAVLQKPSSFPSHRAALQAFVVFRNGIRDWLEEMRKIYNMRMGIEKHAGKTPPNPFCRGCGGHSGSPYRNVLAAFGMRREFRLCDGCWVRIQPKLPNPVDGPYNNDTALKVIRLLRNMRSEKKVLTSLRSFA